MDRPIRVLVVDDHPLILSGVVSCLSQEPDIWVVGYAADGRAALEQCTRLQPDVLVLDLRLAQAEPTPQAIVAHVRERCPGTRILVLTAHSEPIYVRGMRQAGVDGYVLKEETVEAIAPAVRAVARGEAWFSRAVAARMHGPGDLGFTERELQVLSRVARGWSNERIAREMHLSMRSVSEVLSGIYQRLDLTASPSARLTLVAWCNEHGY